MPASPPLPASPPVALSAHIPPLHCSFVEHGAPFGTHAFFTHVLGLIAVSPGRVDPQTVSLEQTTASPELDFTKPSPGPLLEPPEQDAASTASTMPAAPDPPRIDLTGACSWR